MRPCLLWCAALLLTACGAPDEPPLVASDVTIGGPSSGMKAGYMTLTNNTGDAITITAVDSPQFERSEIHETVIEDDVARMRPLETLRIESNSSEQLVPGGRHLMLMRPVGESGAVTLNFYAGDTLVLTVEAAIGSR